MSDAENELRRIVENMGDATLRDAVIGMSEHFGIEASADFIRRFAERAADDACERARERTLYILRLGPRPIVDPPNEPYDPISKICDMAIEDLRDEFEPELANILEVRPEKAPGFLLSIAETLDKNIGKPFAGCEETFWELSDHLRECVEEGNYREAFDFWPDD